MEESEDSVGATDLARRLRRDAKSKGLGSRYWAGWKLQLTFGPYEKVFDDETKKLADNVVDQVLGPPTNDPVAKQVVKELTKDQWHLSVSWRGGFPIESGKVRLKLLVVALGVPEDKREGFQVARVTTPSGQPSPQVTHWVWKEPS
jgi:hypothetical protein